MFKLEDFYFVRHGETDWNREHRGMGQQDVPLNIRGLEQARAAARSLKNEPIQLICTSPLERAKTTAQIISSTIHKPSCEIPELIECGWGDYEGTIKGQWTEDWIAGKIIAGKETYREFVNRVAYAIKTIQEKEGPVLVVSHGGVFWAIQELLLGNTRFDLKNGLPVLLRAPVTNNTFWAAVEIEPNY